MAAKLTLQTIFSAVDKMSGPIKTMKGNAFKFSSETQAAFKKMGDMAKIAGVAALAGAAMTGKALMSFAERGDDIARNAKILGLSAEAYQELSYAANMADVDQETFAASTKKFSKNLADLNLKQGALYTNLAKTNPKLAIQLHHAKSTDEAFTAVADAIGKETNAQKKALIATSAFGKTGQDLIPMMESLAAARDEARKSGTLLSDEEVKSAEALDDSMKKLKAQGMGLLNDVLGKLAPKITPIIEKLTAWVDVNQDMIGQKLGGVLDGIGKGIEFLIQPHVLEGIAALALGIKAIGIASMVMGAGNPMVLLVGGLVTLITMIIANWSTIEAFFGKISEPVPNTGAGVGYHRGSFQAMPQEVIPGYDDPYAPTAPATSSTTTNNNNSTLAIDFNNVPAGTAMKQTGNMSGIKLNTGRQMQGGLRG